MKIGTDRFLYAADCALRHIEAVFIGLIDNETSTYALIDELKQQINKTLH